MKIIVISISTGTASAALATVAVMVIIHNPETNGKCVCIYVGLFAIHFLLSGPLHLPDGRLCLDSHT